MKVSYLKVFNLRKAVIYKNSIETGLESETYSMNSCLA